MSVKFESLSLKNFGPYRRLETLDLATNEESPVVVIHGENTMGKTSIFKAIRWCLYGSVEAPRLAGTKAQSLFEFMNQLAWHDDETDLEVSLVFDVNGQKYALKRRASFDKNHLPRVTADLRIGSDVISPSSIDSEIGRILHPQISEFFLFDGELLGAFYDRLNTERERDLIRTSIESVLGIPALQLAERDVALLTEDVLARQAKAATSQREALKLRDDLRVQKSRQESIEKEKDELNESLSRARSRLADVRGLISAVEELKADAREMETLEVLIESARREETELRGEMARSLSKGWLAPAAPRLRIALRAVQVRNDASEANIQRAREAQDLVDLLRKRIGGGDCPVCRQALPPASAEDLSALKEAEEALDALRNANVEPPNLHLERRIQELVDGSTASRYRELQTRLDKIDLEQFERTRRLEKIKDRLRGNDAARIRQLGDEQDKIENELDRIETSLQNLKPREDEVRSAQDKLATKLRRLDGNQPEVAAEAVFYSYTRNLLGRTIERYKERTRESVQDSASDMFLRLIRDPQGYDGLRIGSDYKVELLGSRGQATQTSEGGKQLIALSLIASLKQAAVQTGPVVLDSPLGRLDLTHRKNVLESWIPALGKQAILLVQSGELTETDAMKILGSNVGHEYRILRPGGNHQDAVVERIR